MSARPMTVEGALALGSWNTWTRISFEEGLEVVKTAYEAGVRAFDVAYYWDKPYTELIFGSYLRVLGLGADDVEISEKIWIWDHEESDTFVGQMERALVRLGLDRVHTALLSRPGVIPMDEYIGMTGALLDSGLAQEWAMVNWHLSEAQEAVEVARRLGVRLPSEIQMQYNVARRNLVESPEFMEFFATTGVRMQPSFTLEGGILAGKLERDRVDPEAVAAGVPVVGRNLARDAGGIRPKIRESLPQLREIADGFGVSTAQLAVAFALLHPHRSRLLMGVTAVDQVREAVAAVDLARDHGPALLEALSDYYVGDTVPTKQFNPHLDRRQG